MGQQATAQESRVRNGVAIDGLEESIHAIEGQPELGTFQFRASNTWVNGSYNRTTIKEF